MQGKIKAEPAGEKSKKGRDRNGSRKKERRREGRTGGSKQTTNENRWKWRRWNKEAVEGTDADQCSLGLLLPASNTAGPALCLTTVQQAQQHVMVQTKLQPPRLKSKANILVSANAVPWISTRVWLQRWWIVNKGTGQNLVNLSVAFKRILEKMV